MQFRRVLAMNPDDNPSELGKYIKLWHVVLYFILLLSGKTLALKQIRADTSHEVSALLVIFVLQNTINNHGQR